jgi:hypothetical protein
MREAFANRKQGETQPENEKREADDDKKTADGHRQQSRHGLPKYKYLKYADDNDDRQKITQAGKCVFCKDNQRVFHLGRNPPGQMKSVFAADILKQMQAPNSLNGAQTQSAPLAVLRIV